MLLAKSCRDWISYYTGVREALIERYEKSMPSLGKGQRGWYGVES